MATSLEHWTKAWGLTPDGAVLSTASGVSLPVLIDGAPAVLTVAAEGRGQKQAAAVLSHFDGRGAVRLLRAEGRAILMERTSRRSLKDLVLRGYDRDATAIVTDVISVLHQRSTDSPPDVPKLAPRLEAVAAYSGSDTALICASQAADRVLRKDARWVILHGDVRHETILDSPRGWLATGPTGLIGDPAYDFAGIFVSPIPHRWLVHDPSRAVRIARDIATRSRHAPAHLLDMAQVRAAWVAGVFGADYRARFCREAISAFEIARGEF